MREAFRALKRFLVRAVWRCGRSASHPRRGAGRCVTSSRAHLILLLTLPGLRLQDANLVAERVAQPQSIP